MSCLPEEDKVNNLHGLWLVPILQLSAGEMSKAPPQRTRRALTAVPEEALPAATCLGLGTLDKA